MLDTTALHNLSKPEEEKVYAETGCLVKLETRTRQQLTPSGLQQVKVTVASTTNDQALKPDTVITAKIDGREAEITVAEYQKSDLGQLRCQTPFRDSTSWNGILHRHDDGTVFVFDNGTRIKYTMKMTAEEMFGTTSQAGSDTNSLPSQLTLDDFLERFTFITQDNLVADLFAPPHAAVMKLQEFKNQYAGAVKLGKSGKPIPLTTIWLKEPKRKTSRWEGYLPGGDLIFKDEYGVSAFNTYMGADFEETKNESLLGPVWTHLCYLFPQEDRLTLFMHWMAYGLQYPDKRIKFTPLLVARYHGTGRGWLAELMSKMLGDDNVTSTKIQIMAGKTSEGQYQNYLNKSVLCVIHEVREKGQEQFTVNDRIRDLLTEDRLPLNLKYGRNGTYQVHANFLMFSNHSDALILPAEDRRIWVHETTAKPQNEEYYVDLYEWLKGDGPRQLYWFLMRWDLSGFNRGMRAPKTPERARMIVAGQSPLAEAVTVLMNELKTDVNLSKITVAIPSQIVSLLTKVADYTIVENEKAQLGKILSDVAVRWISPTGTSVLKWEGQTVRPWMMKGSEQLGEMSPEGVRAALVDTNKILMFF
ncbi:MAG: hypothetical protein HQL69_23175 [Magnetococcales bacterium]|nr:hypothetical protein [Magnetococcales bacterium]